MTDLPSERISEILRLAEKATPGRREITSGIRDGNNPSIWVRCDTYPDTVDPSVRLKHAAGTCFWWLAEFRTNDNGPSDAALFAALDPATVQALAGMASERDELFGILQRFQPEGSPPPLPMRGFAFWILQSLHGRAERAEAALRDCVALIGVMFGVGPDAVIPATVTTPLGIQVKLGEIMAGAKDALAAAPAGREPAPDRKPGRTFVRSDGSLGCDECCNGDRCDDRTHHERRNCPYCLGTGTPIAAERVGEPAPEDAK